MISRLVSLIRFFLLHVFSNCPVEFGETFTRSLNDRTPYEHLGAGFLQVCAGLFMSFLLGLFRICATDSEYSYLIEGAVFPSILLKIQSSGFLFLFLCHFQDERPKLKKSWDRLVATVFRLSEE